jgi:hypothetical protein
VELKLVKLLNNKPKINKNKKCQKNKKTMEHGQD